MAELFWDVSLNMGVKVNQYSWETTELFLTSLVPPTQRPEAWALRGFIVFWFVGSKKVETNKDIVNWLEVAVYNTAYNNSNNIVTKVVFF